MLRFTLKRLLSLIISLTVASVLIFMVIEVAPGDPAQRTKLLQAAQRMISEDYVNGYLFQLAQLSVAKVGVKGLWVNAPTQATDLTAVSWAE
jgi:ABC-type dipeptide/oligopeptide/nickel transport system permease component